MVGKIYDVLFCHPSLVVHAMLKYISRMEKQKTKQTRGDSAAAEDEKLKTNMRRFNRTRRRDELH